MGLGKGVRHGHPLDLVLVPWDHPTCTFVLCPLCIAPFAFDGWIDVDLWESYTQMPCPQDGFFKE